MPTRFPNYYELLSIPNGATQDEIRQAYKRESLRTHPDRLSNVSQEEKLRATEKFQAVADAYYVLSDPTRRKEYDTLFASRSSSDRSAEPDASSSFFANFANIFKGAAGAPPRPEGFADAQRPDAEGVFGDVFEEMLRPEIDRHAPWWTYVGAVSGGALGYIVGNLPGMIFGGYAGNRLGAIRDAKGKSVAVVFAQLGGGQKAQILRALAMKVLGSAL
ncbi:DnaJ domain-containing protein [Gautieria morchelliformis]|nr:DnaJ domain-containing protein [Gautieria morchelliformis]